MTVLHYAVDGGNLDTINFLLNDGIDVNVADTTSGIINSINFYKRINLSYY